ncbi:MAG: NAD-dependent epimerase/dehydratase family protein, partial [Myxococcota bacterium]
ACEDVDAVIHAAGGGVVRETEDYYRGNTESTKALLASLTTQRDFVLISSLAAHGPATRHRRGFAHPVAWEGDDDAPTSHYGKSKRQAELLCAQASDVRTTVLRPPALYGDGEYRMVPLFRLAQRGIVPTVHPEGTVSLLSGRDCARAAVRALQSDQDGGTYFVAEPQPITRRAMAQAIASFAGHRRVLAIPPAVIRAAADVSERIARGRGQRAAFNGDKAADMCAPHQSCDPSKAVNTFAWSAKDRFVDLAPAIGRAYQAKGWLPS